MTFTKKQLFFMFSIVVLLVTTLYWSILSSIVQAQNADQLADPLLFRDWATFSQSIFPTQHTFLLKWPIFYIVQHAPNPLIALHIATVLSATATVGIFAWILSRIEKRSEVLGVVFLVMSAVLLLVPIESKPGALLPVGMGMLTTRNLEYVVFIGAMLLLFKLTPQKLFTRTNVIAAVVLALLFITDQLFMALAFGGAVAVILFALLRHNALLRKRMLAILVISAVAVAVNLLAIYLFKQTGLVDSSIDSSAPYGISYSIKDFAMASIYAVMGILSQFGANPISSTVIAANVPGAFLQSLLTPLAVAYSINTIFCVAIVGSAALVIKKVYNEKTSAKLKRDKKVLQMNLHFSLFMVGCSIASIGLFVATKHYYAVDARYLGIIFFAGFIALCTILATMRFTRRILLSVVALSLLSCAIGAVGAWQGFMQSQNAYSPVTSQNQLIASALEHHSVQTIVGDYWRVYPIASVTKRSVNPLPLDTCFQERRALTSKFWSDGAYGQSFAYLLDTTPTNTGYPACTLGSVREKFGSPSDTFIVSGTAAQPKSMLLFYDSGINRSKPKNIIRPDDTSLLRNLNELKDTKCQTGQTIMQTVAHQDDDILFMNPDLLRGVAQGDCVRTVYMTAGDAGSDTVYWLAREEGARAAYAKLFGIDKPVWRTRDVELSKGHQVRISQLLTSTSANKSRASLIFMRLPDGNVDGRGFANDRMESVQKIENGSIPTITSVDRSATYTKTELLDSFGQLMSHYRPNVVRTQATRSHGKKLADHSDHLAVGILTSAAFAAYQSAHPESSIVHYLGYPVKEYPINVSGDELMRKKQQFFTYSSHDQSTCSSDIACERTAYNFYLNRQYIEE